MCFKRGVKYTVKKVGAMPPVEQGGRMSREVDSYPR